MDQLHNGASSLPHNTYKFRGLGPGGRASVESYSSKLQKKRSTLGPRIASQPQPQPPAGRWQSVLAGNGKRKKGSLRNAVRKIFGRGSKELEQGPESSQQRRGHYKSESQPLSPQLEEIERSQRQGNKPHRTLSAPLQVHPAASAARQRSPYAVEFPRSARLKPLNLGNPLPTPGSQLNRRKTLPSIVLGDDEAAALSISIGLVETPPIPSLEISRHPASPEAVPAAHRPFDSKRRSRSAGDLKGALDSNWPSVPRKRSEEIRYWRGSVQPSILRASGFISTPQETQDLREPHEARTATDGAVHPSETLAGRGSSTNQQSRRSLTPADASIGASSELSKDLEDRVAKLESGLQSFQCSLQRLTAERNRQTVLIGSVPRGRPHSTDARTPSMLADTLSDFEVSAFQSDETDGRPSASPAPSTAPCSNTSGPPRSSPPVPRDETAYARPCLAEKPWLSTDSVIPGREKGSSSGKGIPQMQDYTFRSLYEMLADERSARRNLEVQLKGLRTEIDELHYQVSAGSQQSQRSSVVRMDHMTGSNRVQGLLVDTEIQQPPYCRSSAGTGYTASTILANASSRFSRSESELGAAGPTESQESFITPHEAYQTPAEEQSATSFVFGNHDAEGEMF